MLSFRIPQYNCYITPCVTLYLYCRIRNYNPNVILLSIYVNWKRVHFAELLRSLKRSLYKMKLSGNSQKRVPEDFLKLKWSYKNFMSSRRGELPMLCRMLTERGRERERERELKNAIQFNRFSLTLSYLLLLFFFPSLSRSLLNKMIIYIFQNKKQNKFKSWAHSTKIQIFDLKYSSLLKMIVFF